MFSFLIIYGVNLEKNIGCLFFLWKNVKAVLFILVDLSFIWILLFKMLIVGIYLVKNGILKILFFLSVIWKVCLNGLFKSLFCFPLFEWEQERAVFFHSFLRLSLVLSLACLLFLRVLILDVAFWFHSKWECYWCLIPLRNLLKNQFQGLVFEIIWFLDFLRVIELSKFFL